VLLKLELVARASLRRRKQFANLGDSNGVLVEQMSRDARGPNFP
jgi:hypothetical protein